MKEFFQLYGPAIGPTIAFTLGIIALFIKYFIDTNLGRRSVLSKLDLLKKMILESPPPKKFHPNIAMEGMIHADEARNLANMSRLYFRFLSIDVLIRSIENDVYKYGNISNIREFNTIKLRHENFIKRVKDASEDRGFKFDRQKFSEIELGYEYVKEVCLGQDTMLGYIE
jgi:hypothetical protein